MKRNFTQLLVVQKRLISSMLLLLSLCLYPMSVVAIDAGSIESTTKLYIKHSSGNLLCKGGNARAVIVAADQENIGRLTLIPDGNGYFSIVAADGKGTLQLAGDWDAMFWESDAQSDNAKYSIEKAQENFVKIKCKGNGKYLGTDQAESGSWVYSDKSGQDKNHLWLLTDDINQSLTKDYSYFINPEARKQVVDGWGVSLCWWANMCGKWSDEKIDEIVDWLVSPEGLNYNVFRYNIGGGDDPLNRHCDPHHMRKSQGVRAEMEGFKDSTNGDYIWTRDAAQRKIMLKIKEKRPDAIFEAFSNSCPYYMTYSGCCSGNDDPGKDNLKPEYYEEFAHYLVDVCKHYKEEYGIEFHSLEPFNEASSSYWRRNGGQEGCHFDIESQIKFLKVLSPILKASGLKTIISASDESWLSASLNGLRRYKVANMFDIIGQWNTHTYNGTISERTKIKSILEKTDMKLWMSETGFDGNGINGNLKLAQTIMNDMNYMMPSVWCDWQYVEEWGDQWCLVNGKFAKQTYQKVKSYYVRQHMSKFIKQGYSLLNVANEHVMAARSPQGDTLVLVALNHSLTSRKHTVDLSFYDTVGNDIDCYITDKNYNMVHRSRFTLKDKELCFLLPSNTITTFVIPVKEKENTGEQLTTEATYLLLPRMAQDKALQTNENSELELGDISLSDAQLWNLVKKGNNWNLKNKKGELITYSNAYPLTVTDKSTINNMFSILNVGASYHKILVRNQSRAFDVKGGNTAKGTPVGLQNYVNNESDVARQWSLLALPQLQLPSKVESVAEEISTEISVKNGFINVDSAGGGELGIYSVSGTKLHSIRVEHAVSLPMPKGVYIVVYATGQGYCSQKVSVL